MRNACVHGPLLLRSLCLWVQLMRDDVTLYRRLSLIEPIPRMTPVLLDYSCYKVSSQSFHFSSQIHHFTICFQELKFSKPNVRKQIIWNLPHSVLPVGAFALWRANDGVYLVYPPIQMGITHGRLVLVKLPPCTIVTNSSTNLKSVWLNPSWCYWVQTMLHKQDYQNPNIKSHSLRFLLWKPVSVSCKVVQRMYNGNSSALCLGFPSHHMWVDSGSSN